MNLMAPSICLKNPLQPAHIADESDITFETVFGQHIEILFIGLSFAQLLIRRIAAH